MGAVALSLGVRWSMQGMGMGAHFQFLSFLPAAMVSAWFGGLGPGLLATGLATALITLELDPVVAAAARPPGQSLALYLFLAEGIAISLLCEVFHRTRWRGEVRENALRRSESRMRTLVDSNIIAVAFGGPDGRITSANEAFLRMVGHGAGEIRGGSLNIRDMTPLEHRAADDRARAECHRSGSALPFEKELFCRDGSRVPVLQGMAFLDRQSEEWVATLLDISGRKQTERDRERLLVSEQAARARAEAQEAHYRLLADSLPLFVGLLGPEGTLEYANRSWIEYSGLSVEETLRGGWRRAIHPQDLPRLRSRWRAAQREGRSYEVEFRTRRAADGLYRWFFARTVPIRGPGASIVRWFFSASDIDERKRAEEALRRRETELRLITDALPAQVGYIDADGRYRFCNRAQRDWFALRPEEILGRRVEDVMGGESYRAIRGYVERALKGEEVRFELQVRDGRLSRSPGSCWLEAVYVPDRSPGGEVLGFVTLVQDVTAAKRREEHQRFLSEASRILSSSMEPEPTLERLAHLASERIADRFTLDLLEEDGSIRRAALAHSDPLREERAREFYGRFRHSSAQGEGIPRALKSRRAEVFPIVSEETLAELSQDVEHLEYLRRLPLKSFLISPLIARGKVMGALSLAMVESGRCFDRDDLTLAEEIASRSAIALDNLRLFRDAQQANHMKDEFLAIVSHELRTPLNAVLGWAQLLTRGELDPKAAEEAVVSIQRNARSLSKLIEDLMDISRIIRGKIEMEVRPLELAPVLEGALATVAQQAREKRIEIRRVIDTSLPPVLGDDDRLQQVVRNLLANAVKFTPEGGWVEVRLTRRGQQAWIEVQDNGRGIGREFLPHVFSRFRQEDAARGRRHGGLGLGLAIVRQLVELHGGTVEAESEGEGRGATFTVKLPLAGSRVEDPPPPVQAFPRAGREVECPPSLTGLRILVVDDDADARDLLGTILRQCDAEVRTASSVREALAEVETFRPDIVLTDLGMPDESGYDLLRKMRSLEEGRGGTTPAAAVTAHATSDDRVRALAAGFQMHIPKPVEPNRLLELVASLARGERQA